MAKTKRNTNRENWQEYIRDLEDVYQLSIHVVFDPKGSKKVGYQTMKLYGYPLDDPDPTKGPTIYGTYEVAQWPQARLEKTIVRALIEFTYQCVELAVQSIPPHAVARER